FRRSGLDLDPPTHARGRADLRAGRMRGAAGPETESRLGAGTVRDRHFAVGLDRAAGNLAFRLHRAHGFTQVEAQAGRDLAPAHAVLMHGEEIRRAHRGVG